MTEETVSFIKFGLGLIMSGLYSGSEAAIISIPMDRVKQIIDEKGPRSKPFMFLANKSNDVLSTILIGNNIVNIYISSLATLISQEYFGSKVLSISVGITTLLILIFGEIIPKTFARTHAEKLAVPIIRFLQVNYIVLYPLVAMFSILIKAILGKNSELHGRLVTRNDIEYMLSKAGKDQSIDSKHLDLLTSIMEFPTIKVKEIMVPRNKIRFISIDDSPEDLLNTIKETAHSRYPVCKNDLDGTIGLLHVKDLVLTRSISDTNRGTEKEQFDLSKYLKSPFFVYEHMKVQAVFDHMNRRKVHMALVKDENGTIMGLVTLEDIIEEIVGDIQDEHDSDMGGNASILEIQGRKGLLVNASVNLRDLYNDYDIKFPTDENYSTLAGFLLEMLGNRFPKKGDIIVYGEFVFEIRKVFEREIKDVFIRDVHEDNGPLKKKLQKAP